MNPTDEFVIESACRDAVGASWEAIYVPVTVALSEPHRKYHTARHIADILRLLAQWTSYPPLTLLTAALFHDIVYDPRRADNEERSATFFADTQKLLIPAEDVAETVRLILLTSDHNPGPDDRPGVLLTCADLWVLGSDPGEYAAYRDQVRQEYAHVPDDAWRVGRARVMRTFLERERIYPDSPFSPPGTDEREASARRNVAGEIATLGS